MTQLGQKKLHADEAVVDWIFRLHTVNVSTVVLANVKTKLKLRRTFTDHT